VQWLENCRGRGEPLRELVLPEPGGLSRIGHTVRLAFPSRRDQRLLVELLDESGLRGLEPPLVATVRAIEGRFREFSDRFQAEYRDFQERLSRGVRGVASSPVWRAVRDASLRGASGIRRTRQRFSLVCGPEDPLWMLVVLEAPTALKDEGWAARSMPSEQYAGWSHYLAASDAETEQEGADEAVAALFAGDLAAPPLGRVLEQGVLLFGERSGGIYELESSPPKGGSMLALVRNNELEGFLPAFRRHGTQEPFTTEAPSWPGWFQVGPVNAALADWSGTDLEERIWCLQRHLGTERIRLRGRVRAGGGILGRGPVLPDVHVDADSVVSIDSLGDEKSLVKVGEGVFRFPPHDLEGAIVIEARDVNGETLCRSSYSFIARPTDHAFRRPSDPDRWRTEGAAVDVAVLDRDGENPSGFADRSEHPADPDLAPSDSVYLGPAIGQLSIDPACGFDWVATREDGTWRLEFVGDENAPLEPEGKVGSKSNSRFWRKAFKSGPTSRNERVDAIASAYRHHGNRSMEVTDHGWPEVDLSSPPLPATPSPVAACKTFEEVLAAIGCTRSGVPEGELVALSGRIFGDVIGDRAPWEVLRAWQEAGRICAIAPLRWRGRRYFPIAPSLIAFREAHRVRAVLWGLTTEGLRERIAEKAHALGCNAREKRSLSPLVSPMLLLDGDGEPWIEALVAALELDATRWLRPFAELVASPLEVVRKDLHPPKNYRLSGCWDSESGRFSGRSGNVEPTLERWSRSDAGEFFLRREGDDEVAWWSYSRNWALLAYYLESRTPIFEASSRAGLMRAIAPSIHLPMELARWLAVRGPVLPGPTATGRDRWKYRYELPSPDARRRIMGELQGADGAGSDW